MTKLLVILTVYFLVCFVEILGLGFVPGPLLLMRALGPIGLLRIPFVCTMFSGLVMAGAGIYCIAYCMNHSTQRANLLGFLGLLIWYGASWLAIMFSSHL